VRHSDAQVYGVNLTSAVADVTSIPQINQTLAYFSSPAGIAALQSANDTISAVNVTDVQQAFSNFSQINGVSLPRPWTGVSPSLAQPPAYALYNATRPGMSCPPFKQLGAQHTEAVHWMLHVVKNACYTCMKFDTRPA